ncbi:hypothetical protein [Aquimarina algicola]|uniref:Membrane metalloprotease n=1 Tax=Aquimarina algicola TaxID=2589995 RepID=A0A504ITE1_9FLAO|nr:hypothetical protein [Aquimarina algicola]TPN81747.1 hypothetical protein FHK87_24430 [Aquimarina algicola]
MQIIKLLTYCFIFSFILVGCSDDDDDNNPIQNNEPSRSANRIALGNPQTPKDLLSADNFTSLTIEMVSVQGFEPTAEAVQAFKTFLEGRLFKPDGITINQRTVASSGEAPFTIEEIAEIEQDNRTLFNQGDDITVYIYFADGSRGGDSSEQVTLGSAYLNTSIVIYEGTLRRLASRPRSPLLATIETATLNHEFAHLLGLVNIGTPLQSDHEDEEGGHCNVPNCLMEAAIEFASGMMGIGNVVPQLDAQCIADLQANGGR